MTRPEWDGFRGVNWQQKVDVRDFIQNNYAPYTGGPRFLCQATDKTKQLWQQCLSLFQAERAQGGVLSIDTTRAGGITAYGPGYVNPALEVIVGLQTEKPLERSVNPFGGLRMARQACQAYGYNLDPQLEDFFAKYRKTHNDGVFDAYTEDMRLARSLGIITGLPDAYGRGRIIGDYRRVALYGTDRLLDHKEQDLARLSKQPMTPEIIQLREEIREQIKALQELKTMAAGYGFDISRPAADAREAFQWLYFAYLAAIKEQNGAAMSLGRVSTFLDIYIERDLQTGRLTEAAAQELVDQLVIKLRLARQLRTPEYDRLFAGDPMWITEAIGGQGLDGRTLVTKNSYRFLQTLINLGPSPEPNLTVLWSENLPAPFKEFCAAVSIRTSSVQYENDDLMRPIFGDDYGIACCVSAMQIGKQMQFFGARANLPKLLLLAVNGGRDEITGRQLAPAIPLPEGEVLDYEKVKSNFLQLQDWLCQLYVNTMNVIHYMHDKYAYERLQMALHDSQADRLMAFGLAGLSVVADSFSAIKYAKVYPLRNPQGIAVDFKIEGDFPKYGNDDDRVDQLAVELVQSFHANLQKYAAYRQARHTLSILTITSNVMYGQKTGATPDGRPRGAAFAPGANPMHGRDTQGALASLNSVAKLPYRSCLDGISNTFSIVPRALGKSHADRVANLINILDGYFSQQAHHLNVNVLDRETLLRAMEQPEQYPQLTVRVSGYAVHFTKLSRAHQLEVLQRTFFERF
ncbi:formate C-acetyltransferase [Desulforamulus hydrothermalis]|uniref:Formate acetyltransferase n=1 Tax=Desulforamulus hydrothermalis Lam5 = DSM 18033 TaxID=1121428 RepID=K8DZK6_9FIRM|nr:formate C-acetyltransferase [Desulforamulus hydrothermalis]CCO08534.1 Formate acetyltransferase [Desulforamulus hydrothermalis Lam5 = DSM 18033]SHH02728.1 formate C-acetyltransferase [Desulforamulus hydrothermalis Lam5 = DSM 18033]